MAVWGAAAAIAIGGFGVIGAQHFTPPVDGGPAAVIVPPWRQGGLAFAKEVGLPLLDIRWGGRLLVFAPPETALPLSRMGPFVMPAEGPLGCAVTAQITEQAG